MKKVGNDWIDILFGVILLASTIGVIGTAVAGANLTGLPLLAGGLFATLIGLVVLVFVFKMVKR